MYRHSSRLGALALFLTTAVLVACESSSRTMPASPANPQQLRAEARNPISSTCGAAVAVDAGDKAKCQFDERNYSGPFTVSDKKLASAKIASVSPKTGTSATTFVVSAGKQSGFGTFSVSDANSNTLAVGVAHLASAHGDVCVKPADKAQVALPATSGITATISFLFKPGTKGCDYVRISTGSQIETPPHDTLAALDVPDAASAAPRPLLTISVGEGIGGSGLFGDVFVVSGMQLKVSPDLNFPDGTYYATITTTEGKLTSFMGAIKFVAKDGVLTVAHANGGPKGQTLPFVIGAKSSSIIALYPPGVSPPALSPSPSPTGSATAPPTPFPTSSPLKNAYGRPPPAGGVPFGTTSWDWPDPPCPGVPAPCQWTSQLSGGFTGEGSILIPTNFVGTVTFDAELGYMEIYPPVKIDCPQSYTVAVSIAGAGEIVIPKNEPWVGASCVITLSTLPRGFHGNYYTETLSLGSSGN